MKRLIIICGVSASGKSTISDSLTRKLKVIFLEGDDFHPLANIEKMTSGHALTDGDRASWVELICEAVNTCSDADIVLSCSALTPYVQTALLEGVTRKIIWVKLQISKETARARMEAREHFMPSHLLDSQFAAWNPPEGGLDIDAKLAPETLIDMICDYLTVTSSD